MYLGVKDVKVGKEYELLLTFENNEQRIFDMKNYLSKGIFAELRDKKLFNTVHINFDTIEWENGADIDPELLHSESYSFPQSSSD